MLVLSGLALTVTHRSILRFLIDHNEIKIRTSAFKLTLYTNMNYKPNGN